MFGFWLCMIVAIICGSILFGGYMMLCADNEVKMFEDNSCYEKRLEKLEKQVNKLLEDDGR